MTNLTGLYTWNEILTEIGKRAAKRRLARGRSQVEVASASGVSVATVARFESGQDVAFGAVVKIAVALGADNEFFALFPSPQAQRLDDVLAAAAPHQRKRAPRRRRT